MRLSKLLTVVVGTVGSGAGLFFLWQSATVWRELSAHASTSPSAGASESAAHAPAAATAHEGGGEGGGEHEGAAPASAAKDAKDGKFALLVSLDEMFANLRLTEPRVSRAVAMKLDLELFEDEGRSFLEQRLAGVKSAIIQTAMEQEYSKLNTVSGKLYFKEQMVSRLNEFFNKAVVRDIHFASFYLQ